MMVRRVGVPNLSHCVAAKGGAIEYGLELLVVIPARRLCVSRRRRHTFPARRSITGVWDCVKLVQ